MIARLALCLSLLLTALPASAKLDWPDIWYDPAEAGWGVNLVQQTRRFGRQRHRRRNRAPRDELEATHRGKRHPLGHAWLTAHGSPHSAGCPDGINVCPVDGIVNRKIGKGGPQRLGATLRNCAETVPGTPFLWCP